MFYIAAKNEATQVSNNSICFLLFIREDNIVLGIFQFHCS